MTDCLPWFLLGVALGISIITVIVLVQVELKLYRLRKERK